MSKLFESEDHIVGKVRNIVQFLLTHDFDSAKYYWLVDICGLEPKSNPRCLSAFGTDKNMLLEPIKEMFSRKYTYFCSSNECPAKSGNCDNFSDMTLHPLKCNRKR